MALVYVSGYVTRKDTPSEDELMNDTSFYFNEYGDYLRQADRGGLNIPLDVTVQ